MSLSALPVKISLFRLLMIVAAFCGLGVIAVILGYAIRHHADISIRELPSLKPSGATTVVSPYQYLGSWLLHDGEEKIKQGKNSWPDVVRLSFNKKEKFLQLNTDAEKLKKSFCCQLTPESEPPIFEKIQWRNNQISIFAFRCSLNQKQAAVAEIDTDNSIALYVNGKIARATSGIDNAEIGTDLLIPINLESGENVIVAKVISNGGPPRFRMSLIFDQSKDFQAAWNDTHGFLSKLIYNKAGDSFETPVVKWDNHLDRMRISASVYNVLTEKTVIRKESLRNGSFVRDGGNVLGEGIYKIIYASNSTQKETAFEYFLMGSPQKIFDTIKGAIAKRAWSDTERINIEAQMKRAGILFDRKNYDAEDKQWQDKVTYTLCSLAEFIKLKDENTGNIFKDLKGLQFRGVISKIDNSKQFYRLYIPSNYTRKEKLPLLVVMPTTFAATDKSFLESRFAVSHLNAVQLSKFADKFGFGVLWPGYRNFLMGWTYETAHEEEVLEDVENNYNIDNSRISLYGICSAGFLAGRLAETYPHRYAAIVYDRAIFERSVDFLRWQPDSIREWFEAINPVGRILKNQDIKILVLHDGTKLPGHGDIQLTREYLAKSLQKRPDIKYSVGQRKIGITLWDTIFSFLVDCKNQRPADVKVDVLSESGYAGPIADVFATPFILVVGTSVSGDEAVSVERAVAGLQERYRERFFGSELILKRDTEITDADVKKYSLVLVGNGTSNAVWNKLAAKYPNAINSYNPPDDQNPVNSGKAFAEVFKSPCNQNNYLLLIGAEKLTDLTLLNDFDPFTACFDCYICKRINGTGAEFIYPHRP